MKTCPQCGRSVVALINTGAKPRGGGASKVCQKCYWGILGLRQEALEPGWGSGPHDEQLRGGPWFTADHHFNHPAVIQFCHRPFAGVDEMNQAMVDRWNERVMPGDLVYHLGDFAFGSPAQAAEIARQLNGLKFLIRGNHDKPNMCRALEPHFVWIRDLARVKPRYGADRAYIVLCHYAMRTWNLKHHGAWQLFGHSHGALQTNNRSLDVGVDCWSYAPASVGEIGAVLSKRENDLVDQHDIVRRLSS